jgi:PAS domain-containing protein
MNSFAGLDGDPLRPRLVAAGSRSARPVHPPVSLRRVEPLAAVFLGLHGLIVLASLDDAGWRWAAVGLVLLLGLAGLGGRGPSWLVPVRAGTILAVGVALQATAGGAGGWFVAWPFVLVAVHPLAMPGPAGVVVAGLAVLAYVLVVRLAPPDTSPALAVAKVVLLAGLAALAGTVASAYARMANLATEASLELGRRERLERALLDALPDPTAVLDAQGRIVAVNRAWARVAAEHPADLALGGVGEHYPAARAAAAAAGDDGLGQAAEGVTAVLGGELPLFRCRYLAPGGAGGHEVTVLPLADAEGAVVTDRQAPAPDPG